MSSASPAVVAVNQSIVRRWDNKLPAHAGGGGSKVECVPDWLEAWRFEGHCFWCFSFFVDGTEKALM